MIEWSGRARRDKKTRCAPPCRLASALRCLEAAGDADNLDVGSIGRTPKMSRSLQQETAAPPPRPLRLETVDEHPRQLREPRRGPDRRLGALCLSRSSSRSAGARGRRIGVPPCSAGPVHVVGECMREVVRCPWGPPFQLGVGGGGGFLPSPTVRQAHTPARECAQRVSVPHRRLAPPTKGSSPPALGLDQSRPRCLFVSFSAS